MENPFTALEKRINERFDAIEGMLKSDLKQRISHGRTGGIELAIEVTGLKKQTIYKLGQRRLIPCYKPEGTKLLIFKEAELLDWLASGRMQTESELTKIAFNQLRHL